jgi:hypothetical protein
MEQVPKTLECRVNWNSDKGWYWEGLAGHEVLARGIAETRAVDAKRKAERQQ